MIKQTEQPVSAAETQNAIQPKNSPAPSPSDTGGRKTLGGNAHKQTCSCTICARVRSRIAAGKPPKATERAMAKQRRALARINSKRNQATPRNKREQRIAKRAMLTGAIVGQAAAGVRPNVAQAAKIAGMDPSQAQRQIRGSESIHAALLRAGISDDRIAQVMAEGLDAKETRLVIDHGIVTDAIEFPDWHARHKFVTAVLQTKGYLVKEDASAPGGLIIIAPTSIHLTPGHSNTCQCDECKRTWEKRAREEILKRDREHAIDVESVVDKPGKPLPAGKPVTDEERLADWEDD